ncbi:MAG: hypothetical protein ACREGB_02505 [Candidatus Saccharimonadales bacterium]
MDRKTTFGLLAAIGLIVIVAGFFIFSSRDKSNDICKGKTGQTYSVNIKNSKPSNATIHGKMCDHITYKNLDNVTREIAFGPHENHIPYDGVAERFLNQNQSFTITLNQTGSFHWHDHIHDEVEGYFTVTK